MDCYAWQKKKLNHKLPGSGFDSEPFIMLKFGENQFSLQNYIQLWKYSPLLL